MSEYFLIGGRKFIPRRTGEIQPPQPLWRHFHDTEINGLWRPHAGDPEVFVFLDRSMWLTKDWQLYVRVINYGMTQQKVSAIWGNWRAFANGTGFGDTNDPRADWIQEENTRHANPQHDKIRICGGNVFAAQDMGTYVVPVMMDGSKPPPVKSGMKHPNSIHEVESQLEYYFNEVYEFNPRDHPWMFLVATNVNNTTGAVSPFPNGGLYEWTVDRRMYTFLPHASPYPIQYPKVDPKINKTQIVRLPAGAPIPSPYYP